MDSIPQASKAQTVTERYLTATSVIENRSFLKRGASEPSLVYLTAKPIEIPVDRRDSHILSSHDLGMLQSPQSVEAIEDDENVQEAYDDFSFGNSPPLYVKKRDAYSKIALPQCSPISVISPRPESVDITGTTTVDIRSQEIEQVVIPNTGASEKLASISNLVKIRSNGKITAAVFPGSEVGSSKNTQIGKEKVIETNLDSIDPIDHLEVPSIDIESPSFSLQNQNQNQNQPISDSIPLPGTNDEVNSTNEVEDPPPPPNNTISISTESFDPSEGLTASVSDGTPNNFFSQPPSTEPNEPQHPIEKPTNIRGQLINSPNFFTDGFQDYMEERLIRFKPNDSQHNPNLNHPYADSSFGPSSPKEAAGYGLFGWFTGNKVPQQPTAFYSAKETEIRDEVSGIGLQNIEEGHDQHDFQHDLGLGLGFIDGVNFAAIPRNSSNSILPRSKTIHSAAAVILPDSPGLPNMEHGPYVQNHTPEAFPLQSETFNNDLIDLINQRDNFITSCFSSFVSLFEC